MLKCNYSKTVFPHISLLSIIKLFNLVDNTEGFSFYKKLKTYNRRYSTEVNESLNKIKGKLERLTEERNIDIPNTGINEKSDSQVKKSTCLPLWTFLWKIEKNWSKSNDKRKQKLFWREKDYIYSSGTSLEFDIPDMQNSIAIMPKDCQDEVMKGLSAAQKLIIEKQKSIEINEELNWEYNERIKVESSCSKHNENESK